jgi:hypothetical protein
MGCHVFVLHGHHGAYELAWMASWKRSSGTSKECSWLIVASLTGSNEMLTLAALRRPNQIAYKAMLTPKKTNEDARIHAALIRTSKRFRKLQVLIPVQAWKLPI